MKILFLGASANIYYINWTVDWLSSLNHDVLIHKEYETFPAKVDTYSPDVLFSINYQPLLASISKSTGTPYICWVVDVFFNLSLLIPEHLSDNTIIFSFAREDCERFRKFGYKNVFYLPLAVSEAVLLSHLHIGPRDYNISFIGGNYAPRNEYDDFLDGSLDTYNGDVPDVLKRSLDAAINKQAASPSSYHLSWFLQRSLIDNGLSVADIRQSLSADVSGINDTSLLTRFADLVLSHEADRRFREGVIKSLGKVKMELWGFESTWPGMADSVGVTFHGPADWGGDMAGILSRSKIGLSMVRLFSQSIPMRVVETMACGALCLSKYSNEIPEHFVPGKEIITFRCIEEAVSLASYYLEHDAEREAIAQRGHMRMMKDHKIESRFAFMEKVLGELAIF